PHRLHTCRRVGTAESNFAEQRVVERRDVSLPHVEIGETGGRLGFCEDVGPRRRTRKVRLRFVCEAVALVLTKNAVDVITARADLERTTGDADREPGVVFGRAAASDDVARLDLRAPSLERFLFVPIRIRLDAPLLHAHAAVVFRGVERLAAVVSLHSKSPIVSLLMSSPRRVILSERS